jgi:GNAT superfamily N-acetyltransferase
VNGHRSASRAVRIRRGRSGEGDRLREIAIASKSYWGYDVDRVREWASGADFTTEAIRFEDIQVAEVDGQAVGWAGLAPRGDVCRLDNLWVEPEWIGKGIGRRLFRRAAERALELGARSMEWEAEPNAIGFYEAMGARYLRDSDPSEWGRVLQVMGIDLEAGSAPS